MGRNQRDCGRVEGFRNGPVGRGSDNYVHDSTDENYTDRGRPKRRRGLGVRVTARVRA